MGRLIWTCVECGISGPGEAQEELDAANRHRIECEHKERNEQSDRQRVVCGVHFVADRVDCSGDEAPMRIIECGCGRTVVREQERPGSPNLWFHTDDETRCTALDGLDEDNIIPPPLPHIPSYNPTPEQWAALEAELTELGRNDPTIAEIQQQIEVEKQRLIQAAREVRPQRNGE